MGAPRLLTAVIALELLACGGGSPASESPAPPTVAVPAIVPAEPADPAAAPSPPTAVDDSLRRLLVVKRYLRMMECGHDTAVGELRCAFTVAGVPQPVRDPQTLQPFITDPPGIVLAASDWQPAQLLAEHDAIVAECEFEERGQLGNVHLAAIKGVPGWRYGGSMVVGIARACTIEPYRGLPKRLKVAHLVVMHDDSKRKPPPLSRTRLEAAAIADRAAHDLASGKITFAEAVRRFTDEQGSASRGGALGVLRLGSLVPEFELVLLATPIGGRSPAFESVFGFHILERYAADP